MYYLVLQYDDRLREFFLAALLQKPRQVEPTIICEAYGEVIPVDGSYCMASTGGELCQE
jgi:hypothetical protein